MISLLVAPLSSGTDLEPIYSLPPNSKLWVSVPDLTNSSRKKIKISRFANTFPSRREFAEHRIPERCIRQPPLFFEQSVSSVVPRLLKRVLVGTNQSESATHLFGPITFCHVFKHTSFFPFMWVFEFSPGFKSFFSNSNIKIFNIKKNKRFSHSHWDLCVQRNRRPNFWRQTCGPQQYNNPTKINHKHLL